MEALECGVGVKRVKKSVEELNKLVTVSLKGHIPFSVPVSVRNNMYVLFFHFFLAIEIYLS